tara:strand:- start:3070 stop:4314 length:1245 start_codon:yes stop_codon:yes gene_type:complete
MHLTCNDGKTFVSNKKDLSLEYEPKKIEDFVGNKKCVEDLVSWIEAEEEEMTIIYGPPGVGKSLILKLIRSEFRTDIRNVVNVTEFTDEQIGEILKGNVNTKTVLEMFCDTPQYKKSLILIDDIENRIASDKDVGTKFKSLLVPGIRIIATANSNMIKKLNKLKHIKTIEFKRVEQEELKVFITKIVRLERKRTPYDFPDYVFSQSNGDVRATLKNLEILLYKKSREINMVRDQEFSSLDVIDKLFDKSSGLELNDCFRLAECDTFSIIYGVHENYPRRLKTTDQLSKIADFFSEFDTGKSSSNDNAADCFDIMNGVVAPSILTKYEMEKKSYPCLKTYKIISSSNQRVISKNKIASAIKNMKLHNLSVDSPETHEAIKLQSLIDGTSDNYRWFFNRYVDKKRSGKQVLKQKSG